MILLYAFYVRPDVWHVDNSGFSPPPQGRCQGPATQELTKWQLSSFCIDSLLLGMGSALKRGL